jgi:GNAT superfamily N-acetyltransferase
MIIFDRVTPEDAEQLVKVQLNAFSIDVDLCGEGPPGYDSVERQIELMGNHIYYKISDENIIIGGFYICPGIKGHYDIVRLFVDTSYQGKGIGSMALKYIEELFDDMKVKELEASDLEKIIINSMRIEDM